MIIYTMNKIKLSKNKVNFKDILNTQYILMFYVLIQNSLFVVDFFNVGQKYIIFIKVLVLLYHMFH